MPQDLSTVIWKEWREYLPRPGESRTPFIAFLAVSAIFGIVQPIQVGEQWLTSWPPLLIALFVPTSVMTGIVADAFAGERERHTLETLLASRLSDHVILFGKLIAGMFFGWVVALVTLLLGALALNLKSIHGPHFYRLDVFAAVMLLTFLMSLFAACSGVLISLRTPTVRQAQQLVGLIVLAPAIVPSLIFSALPVEDRHRLLDSLSHGTIISLAMAVGGLLLLTDLALALAAMSQFQRPKLVTGY